MSMYCLLMTITSTAADLGNHSTAFLYIYIHNCYPKRLNFFFENTKLCKLGKLKRY